MAIDRNQRVREREQAQREMGQQLQKFARELADGKTGLLDRFGVQVKPGAYVVYSTSVDLIFEVLDVVPVLDMSRPPGVLKARLACTTDVEFIAGQRALTMIKCGEAVKDGSGDAAIQPPGSQPALAAVPPAGSSDGVVYDEHTETDTVAADAPPVEDLGDAGLDKDDA